MGFRKLLGRVLYDKKGNKRGQEETNVVLGEMTDKQGREYITLCIPKDADTLRENGKDRDGKVFPGLRDKSKAGNSDILAELVGRYTKVEVDGETWNIDLLVKKFKPREYGSGDVAEDEVVEF